MSLLRKLKEENVRLPRFEEPNIYENVIITGISGDKRKKKDGSFMDTLFFLKLAQINPETGEKLMEEDFAFWPTKHDKGGENFAWYASNLATTLLEFLECYYPKEQLDQSFDPFTPFGLTEENYEQDVKKVLSIKKNMDAFNDLIKQMFVAHIEQIIPVAEYNRPVRIKIIPSNDGKRLSLADQYWVESMTVPSQESQLKISIKEKELITKWRAILTGTPAVVPGALGAAMTMPTIPGASIPGAHIPGVIPANIPGVVPPVAQEQVTQPPVNTPVNPLVDKGIPGFPAAPGTTPAAPGSIPAGPGAATIPGAITMPTLNFGGDAKRPF